MSIITRDTLSAAQIKSVNIFQALSGLQQLLENINEQSNNQGDELYNCAAILKLITKQAGETADELLLLHCPDW